MNSTTVNHNESAVDASEPMRRGCGRHRRHGGRCGSIGGLYIAAIVAGFILFWPIGLALLVWAIWRDQIKALPFVKKLREGDMPKAPSFAGFAGRRPSNTALAEYLAREQERLRAEQQKLDELVKAFEAFKEAERQDADRRDFESFLRQRGEASAADDAPPAPADTPRQS
ncbi:MAG: DUF2852 domain-containing protein [Burkholderiaceae bacterium]